MLPYPRLADPGQLGLLNTVLIPATDSAERRWVSASTAEQTVGKTDSHALTLVFVTLRAKLSAAA